VLVTTGGASSRVRRQLLLAVSIDWHLSEAFSRTEFREFLALGETIVEPFQQRMGVEAMGCQGHQIIQQIEHVVVDKTCMIANKIALATFVLPQKRLHCRQSLRNGLNVVLLLLVVILVDKLDVGQTDILLLVVFNMSIFVCSTSFLPYRPCFLATWRRMALD